jgi:hypothetical protein
VKEHKKSGEYCRHERNAYKMLVGKLGVNGMILNGIILKWILMK